MHSNLCATTMSLTLSDYIRLALGTYFPSLIVSSETEQARTYPLKKMYFGFLEESGYMHLQMTKPDTAGELFYSVFTMIDTLFFNQIRKNPMNNNKHKHDL